MHEGAGIHAYLALRGGGTVKGSKNQDTGNSAGERHPEAAYSDPRRAGEARFCPELPGGAALLRWVSRVGRKGGGRSQRSCRGRQQEGPWEGG